MISQIRQLRLDASIILFLIVAVCAAGGFFFAFYEMEDTDRPLAIVRHRSRDSGQVKPIVPTSANSVISQAPISPNDKTRSSEKRGSQENR